MKDTIRRFIVSNFYVADPAALEDSASLLEMGIVDSTGVLDVITFIEREFDIKIPPEDMLPENLDSIERIAAYVTANPSHGHSPRAAARSVERG